MGGFFSKIRSLSSSSSVPKPPPQPPSKVDQKTEKVFTDFKHKYEGISDPKAKAELLAKTKESAKVILNEWIAKHKENVFIRRRSSVLVGQIEGAIDAVVHDMIEGHNDKPEGLTRQYSRSKKRGSLEQAELSVVSQALSEGDGHTTTDPIVPFVEKDPKGNTEVEKWLQTLYKSQATVTDYLAKFTAHGYESLDFVKEITELSELTEIGYSDVQAAELFKHILKLPKPYIYIANHKATHHARYVDYGEFELFDSFDGDYDYELEQVKRGHSFMPVMPQTGFRGGQLGYGATDATAADPTVMVILIAVMVCLCFAFVCILSGVACVGGYAMARFMGAKEGNNDKNQNEYEIV